MWSEMTSLGTTSHAMTGSSQHTAQAARPKLQNGTVSQWHITPSHGISIGQCCGNWKHQIQTKCSHAQHSLKMERNA
jgi:hypothetical protein